MVNGGAAPSSKAALLPLTVVFAGYLPNWDEIISFSRGNSTFPFLMVFDIIDSFGMCRISSTSSVGYIMI